MTANAEIVLEERKGVLAIPEVAVLYKKDRLAGSRGAGRARQERTAPRTGGGRH